jgi:tRNA U34 5-methylaminomethyl-2-thiouridine-forming methyltransferase MnmC
MQQAPPEINILEIGFGTGLNAFMTFLETDAIAQKINYFTLEAYPLSMEHVQQLNYAQLLNAEQYQDVFLKMHTSKWIQSNGQNPEMGNMIRLSPYFNFQKLLMDFEDISFENIADVIYFDAFAPDAQPQLWEDKMMHNMYKAMRQNGVLTTYCAKGSVKRTLKSVGFIVEGLPGPPGKREISRAIKNNNQIS